MFNNEDMSAISNAAGGSFAHPPMTALPGRQLADFSFFNRGGVSMVKGGMAIGGQNFTENMNKQNFTPDPGIEGMSAFDQAVQSGNLQALNIPKIFKGLC